jgi:hypothetical protein
MARYFFNVVDGQFIVDDEGVELPDMPAVRRMAIETAGQILRDMNGTLANEIEWQMHVTDATKKTVFKLTFSATEPV